MLPSYITGLFAQQSLIVDSNGYAEFAALFALGEPITTWAKPEVTLVVTLREAAGSAHEVRLHLRRVAATP